jgi:poly(3-hydroxybutyrate) depolymerase
MTRALIVVTMLAASTAAADVVELPAGKDPVPLVVVLHGDREHAAAAAARWHAAVKKRGWALLALDCPTDAGCKDSFWKWDGEPSWVFDKVAALAKQRAIDPAHVYLVGWSGGASYIGYRVQAWSSHFAAVVIHGGGMVPASADCPDPGLPAYFLVGDRNPLHDLAKRLRAYFDGCKQDVTWDLVRGADHGREEAALTAKKASAILDWLAARHR